MGGAQRVLHGVLERTRGLVAGVTCGAGMPYKLSRDRRRPTTSAICRSSARRRAFRALWKRAYSKAAEWLAAVVYEDPWLAGGHNGLSNAEDPLKPQDPYPRVKALRDTMREGGISDDVPIVMAGGVWYLRDWDDWIDNPELGQIAFQFGTRPLLTQESPIPQGWKDRLTHDRGGRRAAPPLLADRLLFVARCATRSCAASRRARERQIALFDAGRRATTPSSSTSA